MADWKELVGGERAFEWAGPRVTAIARQLAREDTTPNELLRLATVALLSAGPDDLAPRLMQKIGAEGEALREGLKEAGLETAELALLLGVALLAEIEGGGHIEPLG